MAEVNMCNISIGTNITGELCNEFEIHEIQQQWCDCYYVKKFSHLSSMRINILFKYQSLNVKR